MNDLLVTRALGCMVLCMANSLRRMCQFFNAADAPRPMKEMTGEAMEAERWLARQTTAATGRLCKQG